MSKRKEFNSEAKRLTSQEQVIFYLYSGRSGKAKQTAREKGADGYDQGQGVWENRIKLESGIWGFQIRFEGYQKIRGGRRIRGQIVIESGRMRILLKADGGGTARQALRELRQKEGEVTKREEKSYKEEMRDFQVIF